MNYTSYEKLGLIIICLIVIFSFAVFGGLIFIAVDSNSKLKSTYTDCLNDSNELVAPIKLKTIELSKFCKGSLYKVKVADWSCTTVSNTIGTTTQITIECK